MSVAGYEAFEFDLPGALLEKLVSTIDEMRPAAFNIGNIEQIPDGQGVYQLLMDGETIYIGKTDAEAGLRKRLLRHARKVQHRQRLDPESVSFKAVRIYVFTAIDLETQLIKTYRGRGCELWNNNGFGANDPGRERDTTKIEADHFDALFPIDIDTPLSIAFPHGFKASDALRALKAELPYVLRFETVRGRGRQANEELENQLLTLPAQTWTARTLLNAVTSQLPKGWQATRFPGWLILYKETRDYSHGAILTRS